LSMFCLCFGIVFCESVSLCACTQTRLLAQWLQEHCGLRAETLSFPNRTTPVGTLIDQYLKKQVYICLRFRILRAPLRYFLSYFIVINYIFDEPLVFMKKQGRKIGNFGKDITGKLGPNLESSKQHLVRSRIIWKLPDKLGENFWEAWRNIWKHYQD